MLADIKAVAFDIDGTLYPSLSLYWRLVPYIIRHFRFYLHYNKVRKIMHRTAPLPDFYEYQARLLASELGCSSKRARAMIKLIAYDGLKKYFSKIKSFKNVLETFKTLHEKGYKIAINELSLVPYLNLNMRLGEGSGCPLAFEIMDAACVIMNDMATFERAKINDSYLEGIR